MVFEARHLISTKEEHLVDSFAAELSLLRRLTIREALWQKYCQNKKIGMQPGEVAGLTHVGMEPRFGNQSKD